MRLALAVALCWAACAAAATTTTVTTTTSTTTSTLPPTTVAQICALDGAPSGRRCDCESATSTCTITGSIAVNDGSTLDFSDDATGFHGISWNLVVAKGGSLNLSPPTGSMTINAQTLDIKPGGGLSGNGGLIAVNTTGPIAVEALGTSNGKIDVSGISPTSGGEVDLTSSEGDILISGIVNADGKGSAADQGADGGTINLAAWNNIAILAAAGNVHANSANQGAGGDICLASQNGGIMVSNPLTAQGGAGDGGCIDVDAHLDVQVAGLDASSTAGQGSGGMVMITADGNVTMSGPVNVQGNGTTAGGDGGEVCAAATGALTASALIQAQGGSGGSGGCIDLAATGGTLLVQGVLGAWASADNQGDVGTGGMICLAGGPEVDVMGAIDVHGPAGWGAGGEVDGTATGVFNQKTKVTATGGLGSIGIEAPIVNAQGATLVTDDPQGAGEVNLVGCITLTVDAASTVSSVGPTGFNLLQGGGLVIGGVLKAGPATPTSGNPCATSSNCLQYVSSFNGSGATFSPKAEADRVAAIAPCVPPTTTTTAPPTTTTTMPGGTTTTTISVATTTTSLPPTTTSSTITSTTHPTSTSTTSSTTTTTAHPTTTLAGSTTTVTSLPPTTTVPIGASTTSTTLPAALCEETGAPGAACWLQAMDTALTTAPAGAVRSKRLARTLHGRLVHLAALVAHAHGKRAAAKYRRVNLGVRAVLASVDKAAGSQKLDAALAATLTAYGTTAEEALAPLVTRGR
ncbi:MAG TPA: hypothetical protein VKW76_09675 [Candidatus Binatia bacterium]|nr:hypothetical protein [Candidatus Binatia bacterium]